jgi:hypothetical protein
MFNVNDEVIFYRSNKQTAVGIIKSIKNSKKFTQYEVDYFDELGTAYYKLIYEDEIVRLIKYLE